MALSKSIILLFNHKLQRQWEHVIDADLSHAFIEQVAVLIDAHATSDACQ